MSTPPPPSGRRLHALTCAFAVVLTAFGLWQCVVAARGEQPDLRVYEACIAAIAAGEDPYAPGVVQRHGGGALSYAYPPLSCYLLAPLVRLGREGVAFAYAACLLLAAVLLARTFRPNAPGWWCWWTAFAVTGFAAARWNFQTGNIGLLELLVFAVAVVAAHRSRLSLFAMAIAALAYLKALPITFTVLLVPLVRRRAAPWHVLAWPLLASAVLHAVSFALFPSMTASWLDMLRGGTGQHTPLAEQTSGNNTPTFLLLLRDLACLDQGFGLGDALMFALAGVAVWVGARAACCLLRAKTVGEALPLVTIAVLLAWPRLKPYGYGYAMAAVAVGAAAGSSSRALLLLAAFGALPAVMPWLPNLPVEALQLLKRNHLAVLLLASGVAFAWPQRVPAPAGSPAPRQ
jgi:hypothetical protein